ncbi:FAD-dependent oxidoreductase [Chengkuizengella axinellae]|uniref:FAD-dependent oxidoreductase n=1 Tax=Chengkuizengella axinellae TaxID=3064388 RepID=A0ABT9J0B8_9BACL|nr:FAD-dependent oxidoreductase [Chengkuizengella sp. 2205SS18-9]MDP5274847.1 FAD-dependent oxidoreductase [Chengkuizengella sp. 2205SS18-9]
MSSEVKYDAMIIGLGPSALSAGMYLADGGLRTLMIGEQRSQMYAAFVDNYLGFPEGFDGPELLELGLEQIKQRDVQIYEDKISEIKYYDSHIEVICGEGSYIANKLILACGQGAGMKCAEISGVNLEEHNEPYTQKKITIDENCKTSIPNVYATGTAAGVSSQAIIAAGHGAQTALNVLSDLHGERITFHKNIGYQEELQKVESGG